MTNDLESKYQTLLAKHEQLFNAVVKVFEIGDQMGLNGSNKLRAEYHAALQELEGLVRG